MQLFTTASGRLDPEPVRLYSSDKHARLFLALAFLLSAFYMGKNLKRGWIPLDEGTLGLSAQYVLAGELPHKDYGEVYTGGLAYLNALAFRAFGVESASTRYLLYLFFLAWVPAIYYVATHFVSAPLASALTFLAVAWGPPNYPAAMPSWYNLFFATFGLAALLAYIEKQNSPLLVIAGLSGGISFLFKQVGLFFMAAVLLFLLFREQVANRKPTSVRPSRDFPLYKIVAHLAVVLCEASLLLLILKKFSLFALVYFLLPVSFIGAFILWGEYNCPRHSDRFSFLFREIGLFALGAAIPVAIFLAPFVRTGSVPDFIRDVFILPGKQISYAAKAPGLLTLVGGVSVDGALLGGLFLTGARWRRRLTGLAVLGMILGLLLARISPYIYRLIWSAIWLLLPLLVIAGLFIQLRRSAVTAPKALEIGTEDRQKLFLILSVSMLCGLVQFPFSAPTYYCYVAPLVVVMAAAVAGYIRRPPRLFLMAAYCFALLYAVFEVTPGFLSLGRRYEPDRQTVPLRLPHTGHLRTSARRAQTYETLHAIIMQHAHSDYIYATPDCPEMYFIYGFRDPMRYFFDFFNEPGDQPQSVLAKIHKYHINLVVLNGDPLFSPPLPANLRAVLEQEFPNRAATGSFEVRWKP
jgi:hypothetical protein